MAIKVEGVVVEAGAPTANKVEYDAHANVAEAVTLFQANRAEVSVRLGRGFHFCERG